MVSTQVRDLINDGKTHDATARTGSISVATTMKCGRPVIIHKIVVNVAYMGRSASHNHCEQ